MKNKGLYQLICDTAEFASAIPKAKNVEVKIEITALKYKDCTVTLADFKLSHLTHAWSVVVYIPNREPLMFYNAITQNKNWIVSLARTNNETNSEGN